MRGNRCEVYINDVKSKLFPLGSSGCRSNLPAALFGMKVLINEAGKEKENITKQRDSKKNEGGVAEGRTPIPLLGILRTTSPNRLKGSSGLS